MLTRECRGRNGEETNQFIFLLWFDATLPLLFYAVAALFKYISFTKMFKYCREII